MKFNIKNLLNKKSIKKLEKAAVVGVASLALIIPLGMNSNNNVHADDDDEPFLTDQPRSYYYDILVNPSDAMLEECGEMQNIWEHPYLKHTHTAKRFFEDAFTWDGAGYDTYAHHFKQLYSPYLYPAMPKRITHSETDYYKRDEYLLHKGQEQLGLLGHHKRGRRTKRHTHKPRYRKSAKRHVKRRSKRTRRQKSIKKRRNRKPRKRIIY